jgi:hypothetical protein
VGIISCRSFAGTGCRYVAFTSAKQIHECQDGLTSPMKCSQFGFTLRGSSQTLELICKGENDEPAENLLSLPACLSALK